MISAFMVMINIQNPAKQLRWSFFAKILNGRKLFSIFAKSSMLDVCEGSEYPSKIQSMLLVCLRNSIIRTLREKTKIWKNNLFRQGQLTTNAVKMYNITSFPSI